MRHPAKIMEIDFQERLNDGKMQLQITLVMEWTLEDRKDSMIDPKIILAEMVLKSYGDDVGVEFEYPISGTRRA